MLDFWSSQKRQIRCSFARENTGEIISQGWRISTLIKTCPRSVFHYTTVASGIHVRRYIVRLVRVLLLLLQLSYGIWRRATMPGLGVSVWRDGCCIVERGGEKSLRVGGKPPTFGRRQQWSALPARTTAGQKCPSALSTPVCRNSLFASVGLVLAWWCRSHASH